MAKTETAAYGVERAKLATAPVYLARFFHVKAAGDAMDFAFSRDFASRTVSGATKNPILALGRPRGNVQTIEPEQGRSSQGTFVLPLLDLDGEILAYMSNPRATLAVQLSASGGETFAEATQALDGYPDQGTIEVDAERIRYAAVDLALNRFTGITRAVDGTSLALHSVGATINNGEQIRPGQRVQLFAGYAPLAESDYLSFAKMELMERGVAEDGLTWLVRAGDIQRWLRKLVFTAARTAAKVTLTGNPVTLALQIMTSTGAGTNGAYDVLAASNGLAIPAALIDVAGLEALRDAEFAGQTYQFSLDHAEEGKAFIEREFWKTLTCIPFITQTGKYSAKRIKPAPAVGTVTQVLTAAEIIRWQWSDGARLQLNEAEFFYDWDADGQNPGTFATRQRYTASASATKFGKRPALLIESKGIRTSQGGQTILDDRAFQLFKRYADPPPVLEVDVFYQKHLLDIGDPVKVTHASIPNIATGRRGLTTEVFEVIDLRPQFGADGRVTLTLAWTGSIVLPAAPTSAGALGFAVPTRDTTAPAAPSGLALTPSGDLFTDGTFMPLIAAAWTANAEADLAHYVIEWRVLPGAGDPAWTVAGGSGRADYIIRALKPATTYQVRVRAIDTSGNQSAYSAIVTALTPADPGAPAAPTGLSVTAFVTDLRVNWSPNPESDIIGYSVQRADNLAFTTNVVELAAAHRSSWFLDSMLGRGTEKFYRVFAIRRTGATSAASAIVSGTTPGIGPNDLRVDVAVISVAAQIQNAIIQTAHIIDLNVTTLKIADLNVTSAKIANLAVTSSQIADLTVNNGKITDATISTGKIGDAQISTAKIADANITTAKIGDLNVTTLKVAGSGISTSGGAGPNSGTLTGAGEATLASFSLPAGSVSQSVLVNASIAGTTNGVGGTNTLTLRLKQGGTVLATYSYNGAVVTDFRSVSWSIATSQSAAQTYALTAEWSLGGLTYSLQSAQVSALGIMK